MQCWVRYSLDCHGCLALGNKSPNSVSHVEGELSWVHSQLNSTLCSECKCGHNNEKFRISSSIHLHGVTLPIRVSIEVKWCRMLVTLNVTPLYYFGIRVVKCDHHYGVNPVGWIAKLLGSLGLELGWCVTSHSHDHVSIKSFVIVVISLRFHY